MDGSAYWTVVGGIVIACIAAIGNIAVKVYEKWSARDFTQKGESLELERAHEGRAWAEINRRIADLKEEVEKLEKSLERRDATIETLSKERDRLRVESTDWQIEARKAAALKDQCEQERQAHAAIVERLSSEIRRLRGDH